MALLRPPTADGSEIFDELCHHFLQHEPLSRWLMNHDPHAAPQPRDIDLGIAFRCTFPIPSRWSLISTSFAMGEMMVPIRFYGRFICGVIVAATNIHKYAACIAHELDASYKSNQPDAFRSSVRRIVCDIGGKPDDVINLIDFAWMDDKSLIVSTKVMVPPIEGVRQPTCTGSFGIYHNVVQRGKLPQYPKYVVSYAEVPHCAFCSGRSVRSGCICTSGEVTCAAAYIPPPTPAPSSHLISLPPEAPTIPWVMRIAPINKTPVIRVSTRLGSWRRDATGVMKYRLDLLPNQIQLNVLFAMSSDCQMHALRQVAAISSSFGSPTNVASARLLHDISTAPDARDEFRKRHEINTEILNALVTPEKQEPIVSVTEEVEEASASFSYDTIDFEFDPPFISSSLTVSHLADKTVCDKFFPYRPPVETAHQPFSPLSSRGTAQFAESPIYNSEPVHSVEAYLDLAAASQPPPPRTPGPTFVGATASPVTPAMDAPSLVHPVNLQDAPVKAAKRVRHVPSSGVCDVCGKYFFKSGALVRHTRSAHPEVSVLPREPRSFSVSSSGGGSSGGRHPTGRLDCPRCPKTFSQQGSLNRHLRSIHEARKLHCRYCDLAFGQAFDLKRHQKRKHPGSVLVVPTEALPRFAMRERPFCDVRQQG